MQTLLSTYYKEVLGITGESGVKAQDLWHVLALLRDLLRRPAAPLQCLWPTRRRPPRQRPQHRRSPAVCAIHSSAARHYILAAAGRALGCGPGGTLPSGHARRYSSCHWRAIGDEAAARSTPAAGAGESKTQQWPYEAASRSVSAVPRSADVCRV